MKKRTSLFITALMLTSSYPVLASADTDVKAKKDGHMSGKMMMGAMSGKPMAKPAMQGGSAPADARDPHAFSDGVGFDDSPRPVLADEISFASALFDRLETYNTDGNGASAIYDVQFWYGRDYERLVIKAEGDYSNQSLEETSTELLWSHAFATFWNTQLGVRYDTADTSNQTWLGFGVQGLAPYWFEVDFTAYIGQQGRTAMNVEADYDILFTQKLILQPRLEVDVNGKDDKAAGIGQGVSNASVGLRLRYEIRREIAPYVGVDWTGKFGATADYAQASNLATSEARVLAGMRLWF